MMKKLVLILMASVMICSGCSKSDEEHGKRQGEFDVSFSKATVDEDDKKGIYEGEPVTQICDGEWLKNVKNRYNIGDEIVMGDYAVTINDVDITKEFKEDLSEWSEYVAEWAEIEDDKIVNDCRIMYIDYEVKNMGEKDYTYCIANVTPKYEKDGLLLQASTNEIDYCKDLEEGQNAYINIIKSNESKKFRVGIILFEESLNHTLYLETSGYTSDTDMYLVEID